MSNLIIQHPWLILIGLFISIGVSLGYYFGDKKFSDVRKLWIYMMAFLRFMSIFLLFLLLADVIIKTVKHIRQKPIIVWLQDNSQSIALATDTNYIVKYEKLLSSSINQLSKEYDVRSFLFDKDIKKGTYANFSGIYTNISKALQDIRQRYYNENIGLIILATDGNYNQGFAPNILARSSPYPIFTVWLGDTTEKKDLKITNIQTNKIAYLGEKFPVQVNIEAHFAKGSYTIAQVFLDGHLLAQEKVNITKQNFERKIKFLIKANSPGKKLLTVKLRPIANELNLSNNQQTVVIDVINAKEKILILSCFPHPDIAALERVIANISTYEVKFSYLKKFKEDIENYNLIILYQIPCKKHNSLQILRKISSAKKPVLIIYGSQTDYSTLKQMPLGFKYTPVSGSFDLAQPLLNNKFSFFIVNPDIANLQDKLPPLLTTYGDYEDVPENSVIFYQKINNLPTQKPLLLLLNDSPWNNNKIGIIFGEGIWRWFITEFKYNHNNELTNSIFKQIIQFLLVNEQKKRFIVKIKPTIDQNEDVIFTAELYDKTYNPITQPEVKLTILDSTKKQFKYIMEHRGRYYFLNIGRLSQGIYTYKAHTNFGNEKFTERGSFAVRPVNIESLKLKANINLLEEIASVSGGQMLSIEQLPQLKEYIKNISKLKTISLSQVAINKLIKQKFLFFIILIMLTLEWILRKYFGNI